MRTSTNLTILYFKLQFHFGRHQETACLKCMLCMHLSYHLMIASNSPQGAGERQWELSENPTDEGIQPDIQPRLSYTSHASVQSNSLANFHLGMCVCVCVSCWLTSCVNSHRRCGIRQWWKPSRCKAW